MPSDRQSLQSPITFWTSRNFWRRIDLGMMTLAKQLGLDFVAPPVLAGLWWLMSRGWANAVQVGNVSETTRLRQRYGFWIVLGLLYVMMFGTTIYLNITQS